MASVEHQLQYAQRRWIPAYVNRTFGMVWSGLTLSALGDGFAGVAMGLWVLQATGSAMAMSQVMLVRTVVGVLFGAFAGTVADRFDRKLLMILCDAARGLIYLTISWLMVSSQTVPLGWILVLMGLSAVFANLFDPAVSASVIHMVGTVHVSKATSLMQLSYMVANVVGPILGGAVVGTVGGYAGMLANAVSFLLSGLFILLAGRIGNPAPAAGEQGARPPFLTLMVNGFRFLRSEGVVGSLVLVLLPLMTFFTTAIPLLMSVLLVTVLKVEGTLYGAIQGMFAAGYAVGLALLMAKGDKLKGRGLVFGAGVASSGLLFAAMGIVDSAYPFLPIMLLVGAILSASNLVIRVVLQTQVPPEMQGRVFGVAQTMMSATGPLSLLLVGVISDRLGAAPVALGAGLGLSLVGVLALAIRPVRQFQ